MGTHLMIRKKENGKQKMKSSGYSSAPLVDVAKAMGELSRSDNSLNQHIKLKHPELWSKFKIQEGDNFNSEIGNNDTLLDVHHHRLDQNQSEDN